MNELNIITILKKFILPNKLSDLKQTRMELNSYTDKVEQRDMYMLREITVGIKSFLDKAFIKLSTTIKSVIYSPSQAKIEFLASSKKS